jgi:pimeloyl-ACP methyl ester carboxylesterase
MQPIDLRVPVADGVRLRVRHWPAAGAPPFLLVHGLSSNARLWDGVAARLAAAGRPAYAVDLRSHGESDAPPSGYDTATAAADVAAVTAGLGLAPAVVAGQSWGGNVVVRLAAEHPGPVAALALVDGGWIDLGAEFDSWDACAAALRPPDVDGMRASELRGIIARQHADWADWAVDATLANLRVTDAGFLRRRLAIDDHMSILRSMWADPPWRDYARVSVPTLLVPAVATGEEAASKRRALVAKAAAGLARSRVREYVGADHDLHAQRPAELADDLLALADEVA